MIYLLSEDTGFTFSELFHMRMELLIGLKNVKDSLIEERNKAQEKAQSEGGSSNPMAHLPPGMSSMMSKVSSMSPSSFKMPSMPAFPH